MVQPPGFTVFLVPEVAAKFSLSSLLYGFFFKSINYPLFHEGYMRVLIVAENCWTELRDSHLWTRSDRKHEGDRVRIKAVLLVTVMVIFSGYFASPFLVPPARFLNLAIENLRLSHNGLWLNFTVVIRNGGIWPLVLDQIHLHYRDADGRPIDGFPISLTVLPMQAVRIEGFGTYASNSYSESSCCSRGKPTTLIVTLDGCEIALMRVFGARYQALFNIQATAALP